MVPGRRGQRVPLLNPLSTTLGPPRVHAPSWSLGIGDPIPLPGFFRKWFIGVNSCAANLGTAVFQSHGCLCHCFVGQVKGNWDVRHMERHATKRHHSTVQSSKSWAHARTEPCASDNKALWLPGVAWFRGTIEEPLINTRAGSKEPYLTHHLIGLIDFVPPLCSPSAGGAFNVPSQPRQVAVHVHPRTLKLTILLWWQCVAIRHLQWCVPYPSWASMHKPRISRSTGMSPHLQVCSSCHQRLYPGHSAEQLLWR